MSFVQSCAPKKEPSRWQSYSAHFDLNPEERVMEYKGDVANALDCAESHAKNRLIDSAAVNLRIFAYSVDPVMVERNYASALNSAEGAQAENIRREDYRSVAHINQDLDAAEKEVRKYGYEDEPKVYNSMNAIRNTVSYINGLLEAFVTFSTADAKQKPADVINKLSRNALAALTVDSKDVMNAYHEASETLRIHGIEEEFSDLRYTDAVKIKPGIIGTIMGQSEGYREVERETNLGKALGQISGLVHTRHQFSREFDERYGEPQASHVVGR